MPTKYTPRSTSKDVKGRFVTVAFDEKTRYTLEIAARKEHRTVSNFINEAVLSYIPTMTITECNERTPLSQIIEEIWSPFAATRFVLQADRLSTSLTFEEEILWKIIQSDNSLWNTGPHGEEISRDGNAEIGIRHEYLRERWEELKAKAKEIAAQESEPISTKAKTSKAKKGGK
jgi:hypothetical protein